MNSELPIPEDLSNKYKQDFAEHFKEKCIFRALSLANINEEEQQYEEDIDVFAGECENRDRMNRGFYYANKENNKICQLLINEARRTSDINYELNIDYSKILVLFGSHLLEDLKMLKGSIYCIEKAIHEPSSDILFFQLGKLSIGNHNILILEPIDGLNFSENGALIFRSNNEYDFRQLELNYDNFDLTYKFEGSEKVGKVNIIVKFPQVDKLDNIEYSYYELANISDLGIVNI